MTKHKIKTNKNAIKKAWVDESGDVGLYKKSGSSSTKILNLNLAELATNFAYIF